VTKRINDFQIAEHFNLIEFQCPCCHKVLLNPLLVSRLEILRQKISKPIIINSGFRCQKHNEEVGGVANSKHRLGQAADVRVIESEQSEFCETALKTGFIKAIAYRERGFVHLEIGA
jgi:uncharacterized protein YcbK (DUF882 family)